MQNSILNTVKIVTAMIAVTLAPHAFTQSLYWDANGTDPGAGATPTGNFSTDLFWNAVEDGTGTPAAWVPGSIAVFSAGNDASGGFTVTMGSAQTAGGVTVEEGVVTMAGTAALTLNGGANINIANGSSWSIPASTVPLSAAGGFTKSGGGTLTLNTSASALGAVNILGGVVATDSSARLAGTGTITIDGGTLRDTGTGNGSSVQVNHPITIGGTGGRIETTGGFGIARLSQTVISGGTLTKGGASEFRVTGGNTFSKLVVESGLYRIGNLVGATETGFGAVPGAFTADQITLNGGG
ncbi:MAG TPA: hypothetical protein VK850_10455, partial [Candidatus Binatia bacterium]|nr:hypothetical protein [Candidatus Binatia bacterium]